MALRTRPPGPKIAPVLDREGGALTTVQTPDAHVSAPEVTVSCRQLWKVYGPRPDRIIGSPEASLSRAELLEKTGCVCAVRDISFDVRAGEVFVVMGLSGSGKSTLIRCLSRLIEPTAGQVVLDGENVLEAGPDRLRELRRHKMSMVFQHFGLFPHRRIVDNVAYGLEVQGLDRTARTNRAEEVLSIVGLAGWGHAYPEELSGGMQQRVGLARALATNPDILLFDEPFSALDPLIRRDMQDFVITLHRDFHTTMIFITHDLMEALKLGTRIAIMKDGAFVQVGTPEEVVAHPADAYVADFTRDVPRAHVLTARSIMVPADGRGDAGQFGADVGADVVVQELIPLVAGSDLPLRVVEEDRVVGLVDRRAVMQALIEERT